MDGMKTHAALLRTYRSQIAQATELARQIALTEDVRDKIDHGLQALVWAIEKAICEHESMWGRR